MATSKPNQSNQPENQPEKPAEPDPTTTPTDAAADAEADRLEREVEALRRKLDDAEARLAEHDEECDRRVEDVRRDLDGRLQDCNERAAALQEQLDGLDADELTYDEAVADAAAAYLTTFDALTFVAAGAFDAVDAAVRQTKAGRIAPADTTDESVALMLRLADHLGAREALVEVVDELERDVFDRATGYPTPIARLVDVVREYAEALCDCEGEPIWAEAAFWATVDQLRDELVAWGSSWTLAGARIVTEAHQALVANAGALHTCPTPGATGGAIENVALVAGKSFTDARELQLWFDRTRPATEAVLELVQLPLVDRAPDRIIELARLIAPVTIGTSPVRVPLVGADRRRWPRPDRAPVGGGSAPDDRSAHGGAHGHGGGHLALSRT